MAEITNTGQISEKDQELLHHGDGSGRGLHIAVRLIKHMGGKLEVEAPARQTVFRLFMPLAKETGRDEKV